MVSTLVICSNCGGYGHKARVCPTPSFELPARENPLVDERSVSLIERPRDDSKVEESSRSLIRETTKTEKNVCPNDEKRKRPEDGKSLSHPKSTKDLAGSSGRKFEIESSRDRKFEIERNRRRKFEIEDSGSEVKRPGTSTKRWEDTPPELKSRRWIATPRERRSKPHAGSTRRWEDTPPEQKSRRWVATPREKQLNSNRRSSKRGNNPFRSINDIDMLAEDEVDLSRFKSSSKKRSRNIDAMDLSNEDEIDLSRFRSSNKKPERPPLRGRFRSVISRARHGSKAQNSSQQRQSSSPNRQGAKKDIGSSGSEGSVISWRRRPTRREVSVCPEPEARRKFVPGARRKFEIEDGSEDQVKNKESRKESDISLSRSSSLEKRVLIEGDDQGERMYTDGGHQRDLIKEDLIREECVEGPGALIREDCLEVDFEEPCCTCEDPCEPDQTLERELAEDEVVLLGDVLASQGVFDEGSRHEDPRLEDEAVFDLEDPNAYDKRNNAVYEDFVVADEEADVHEGSVGDPPDEFDEFDYGGLQMGAGAADSLDELINADHADDLNLVYHGIDEIEMLHAEVFVDERAIVEGKIDLNSAVGTKSTQHSVSNMEGEIPSNNDRTKKEVPSNVDDEIERPYKRRRKEPSRDVAFQTLDRISSKPLERPSAKPLHNTSTKPREKVSSNSLRQAPVNPADKASSRPSDTFAKPSDKAFSNSAETASSKPSDYSSKPLDKAPKLSDRTSESLDRAPAKPSEKAQFKSKSAAAPVKAVRFYASAIPPKRTVAASMGYATPKHNFRQDSSANNKPTNSDGEIERPRVTRASPRPVQASPRLRASPRPVRASPRPARLSPGRRKTERSPTRRTGSHRTWCRPGDSDVIDRPGDGSVIRRPIDSSVINRPGSRFGWGKDRW